MKFDQTKTMGWITLVIVLVVIGGCTASLLGCRLMIVRSAGNVCIDTEEVETRSQIAGTNGRNRNLEVELDGR